MNFYLSAINGLFRHPDDKPTIGLLLCKEKDKLTVEYALRDMKKPIGVANGARDWSSPCPNVCKANYPQLKR